MTYNDNSGPTRQYKQILSIHDYKQLVTTLTRISKSTANILDHIIFNREDKLTQLGMVKTGISDHYMIYCMRNHNRHNSSQRKTMKISLIINNSKQTNNNIQSQKKKKKKKNRTDVNVEWTISKTLLTEAMDARAPEKKKKKKKRTDPLTNNKIYTK